jgi:hypothetical protein
MSENVEVLKRCSTCHNEYPVIGWKAKPNGELYRTCEVCRGFERTRWRRNAIENNVQKREYEREKYHTQAAYEKRCLRVQCPDCDKEMTARGLRAHVKNKSCKGRKPEV